MFTLQRIAVLLTIFAVFPTSAQTPERNEIVVFTSDRDGGKYQLFFMESDGSNIQQLTDDSDGQSYLPIWSPNGSQILYVYEPEVEPRQFRVIDADGTHTVTLTDDTHEELLGIPRWSPDSESIYYCVRKQNDPPQPICYTVTADGKKHRLIAPLGIVPLNAEAEWTPDGKLLLQWDSGLYLVESDGSDRMLLISNSPFDYALSRDGKHLALAYQDGIYLQDTNGTDQNQLHDFGSFTAAYRMRWSPTGEQIAVNLFYYDNPDMTPLPTAKSGLYLLNSDGTNFQWITDYEDLAWSPDGKRIVYTASVNNTFQVFVANADGSNAIQITDEGNNVQADWKP